ncbi:hypothetical protein NAT51_09055 [Flavobacterium amniphilum]|uniref:hypothetical protein n=1 Tax=Flavobacterium amniphilum TaxID=1834035 RepID=UPI00202A6D62|nr:hypothetical protein [Flavobacterium amniphilum]MCL9805670.1 hypothetical protein [Flavobacterium amniphilum]
MNSTSDFEINNEKPSLLMPGKGHAKNVSNFQLLISFCHNLGAVYNPSNPRLKINQLELLYQSAFEKLNLLCVKREEFNKQTANRRKAFEDLKPLATKITNAFAASGVDKIALENAKAVNKMIQGVILKVVSSVDANGICTSQQSYDKKITHFEALIHILEENPMYCPNEEELKVISLKGKLDCLQRHNSILSESYKAYNDALHQRNHVLYNSETGLLQTVKEVKQYVKSVFGANSFQYHQVGGLQFKVRTGE